MRRDLTLLTVWLAVSFGVLLTVWLRPAPALGVDPGSGEQPHLGDVAGRALPTLEELQGLRFAADTELPAWTAARAVPASSSGPLTLAGLWHGLELESVRVDLGEDVFLVATAGRFAEQVLALGPLHGEVGARRLLVASGARIGPGELRLGGPVVFWPGDPQREEIVREWSGSVPELRARLRR